jgi:hypothetical protein
MFNTIDDLRNSRAIIREFWEKYRDIGECLSAQDMFVMSILNRMADINDAFNELTTPDNYNYLGAAPLVRLQIDTLIYAYAGTLVDDFIEFLKCFMAGDKWTKLKDSEGNELKESYLVEKLTKLYGTDEFKRFYKELSNFVHLSNNHLFTTIWKDETTLGQRVEKFDVPENEQILRDIMFGINRLLFHLLVTNYVWARQLEMNRLKELQAQYPNKSTEELYAEFTENDTVLNQLFFGQLRQKK